MMSTYFYPGSTERGGVPKADELGNRFDDKPKNRQLSLFDWILQRDEVEPLVTGPQPR
jgi:hypothetical protein